MTKWRIPKELERAIDQMHNPTQADIDKAQDQQIKRLEEVDKKHNGQFVIALLLNIVFFVWIAALSGVLIWGKK